MSIEDESRRIDDLLAGGHISEDEAVRAKARLLEKKQEGIAEERREEKAEDREREGARGAAGNTVPVDMRAAVPGPRRTKELEPISDMQVVSEHSEDLDSMREAVDDEREQETGGSWKIVAAVAAVVVLGGVGYALSGEDSGGDQEPPAKMEAESDRGEERMAENSVEKEEVARPARVVEAVKAEAPAVEESASKGSLPAEYLGKWVVDIVAMRALPEYARRHELEFVKDAARFSAMRFDLSSDTVTQTLGKAPQRHQYTIQEQTEGRVVLALTDSGGRETQVTLAYDGASLTMIRENSSRKMILIREGAASSAVAPAPEEETAPEEAAPEEAEEAQEVVEPEEAPAPEALAEDSAAPDATHEVFNTAGDAEEPWLNMRRGPSSKTIVTGRLSDGTKVKFLAGSRDNWWKVEVLTGDDTDKTGFVNSNWLKKL